MLGDAMYTTIETLWNKGLNKSEISRATGHDWKTVSKVIKKIEAGQAAPSKKPHPCILDPYKERILELMEQGLSAVRIYEELTLEGSSAAYPTVKRYVGRIKKRENIFMRIHTKPAEEAQVDFGYAGYTLDNDGKRRKTWVFNMKLSYSRLDFYKKVYNQRVETFIECHIDAFKYFKGVPRCVRIDNLKAAVLQANFYEPVYQHLYRNFSEHYNFQIIPCRVYRPNDKGKVESGIKYVKNNFFAGRIFKSSNDLDKRMFEWQENVCNCRIHGTTRKVPREVFERDEKHLLTLLPDEDFKMIESSKRKVYHDSHIFVKYNYYSVPFEYIGKEVDIHLSRTLLKIFYNNKEVAVHTPLLGKGEFSTISSHYPSYKMYSATEHQEKYQVKMSDVGIYAEQIFFYMLSENPNGWGKSIQGILSLLKKYPKDIVDLACKRALAFNACQYQTIKNICKNGSYNLPVEFNFEEMKYANA